MGQIDNSEMIVSRLKVRLRHVEELLTSIKEETNEDIKEHLLALITEINLYLIKVMHQCPKKNSQQLRMIFKDLFNQIENKTIDIGSNELRRMTQHLRTKPCVKINKADVLPIRRVK